jgi:hypothetical protein
MNQTQPSSSAEELRPLAGADAASAPARSGFTLRGRTWVYSATLVAAGVLGGSGVAYAVVPPSPTVQTQSAQQGMV